MDLVKKSNVSLPLYVTSLTSEREPDSTWTFSPPPPRLIIRSDKADTSVPDHTAQVLRPNGSFEPSATSNGGGEVGLEVYRLRHSQITTCGAKFHRHFRSARVCCRKYLFHSGRLQGTVFPSHIHECRYIPETTRSQPTIHVPTRQYGNGVNRYDAVWGELLPCE